MMHVRYADEQTVTAAIDQCADVGFEMVILTFGSGFDLENEQPETLARARQYADYARSKGIEIGSYSLLASRHIDRDNDVVMPPDQKPAFGNSPCLGSTWGVATTFAASTTSIARADSSCWSTTARIRATCARANGIPATAAWPIHAGHQWRTIADFYHWCRGEGIYLNVPTIISCRVRARPPWATAK